MPKRLVRDDATATPTYAKFIAEPLEAGYGHTIGNSLRRVLLSSLEGAAVSSVKIEGAPHEFTSIPGVVEDVTDIVLNLKRVLLKVPQPRGTCGLSLRQQGRGRNRRGHQERPGRGSAQPEQHICTIDKKMHFEAELEIKVGRGFCPAEENKKAEQTIGVIAIDSLFSPVRRVRYSIEDTRVGQRTDYDKLIIEVWTDGRITPEDAMVQSTNILRHHLDVFCDYDKNVVV